MRTQAFLRAPKLTIERQRRTTAGRTYTLRCSPVVIARRDFVTTHAVGYDLALVLLHGGWGPRQGMNMGKTTKILTIADASCAASKHCSMASVTALAGILYGAPATSIVVVKNHAELIQVLSQYSEISRLVVMLEGSEGDLYIDGHARSLSSLADDLKKANATTRVDEIVFDSCNVIKGVSGVADLMEGLGVRRASGPAAYHVWNSVQVNVRPKSSAAELEAAFKSVLPAWDYLREYVAPGQLSLADLALRGGRQSLYFEFFTRDYGFSEVRLKAIRGPSQLHGVLPRSKLVARTYRTGDASAKKELESLAGPIYSVTFERGETKPSTASPRPAGPQRTNLQTPATVPQR